MTKQDIYLTAQSFEDAEKILGPVLDSVHSSYHSSGMTAAVSDPRNLRDSHVKEAMFGSDKSITRFTDYAKYLLESPKADLLTLQPVSGIQSSY